MVRPQVLFGGTDPLHAANSRDVQYATCALLFNHPDQPFPAGAQLQPEIAAAMPTVTDGGRTHRIRVRSGFRFAPPSIAPVTAQAIRHVLVRALHPRSESYAAVMMSDIVGAAAFTSGRAKRLEGVTATGDTLTIRLSAPSRTLPARLANPLFCAVPPTTPTSPSGVQAIPRPARIHRVVRARSPPAAATQPALPRRRPARLREIDFDLDVSPARAEPRSHRKRGLPARPRGPRRRPAGALRPGSAAARAGRQRYFSGTLPALHLSRSTRAGALFAEAGCAGRSARRSIAARSRRACPFPPPPAGRAA